MEVAPTALGVDIALALAVALVRADVETLGTEVLAFDVVLHICKSMKPVQIEV
jgi:hypothetical protein